MKRTALVLVMSTHIDSLTTSATRSSLWLQHARCIGPHTLGRALRALHGPSTNVRERSKCLVHLQDAVALRAAKVLGMKLAIHGSHHATANTVLTHNTVAHDGE